MLTVFHCGTCWAQNSITSATRRTCGSGGKDELVLGVKLLEDVVLQGAAQVLPVDALIPGVGEVKRHDHDGWGVDGHRHRNLAEVDAVVQLGHVVERVHRDAEPADLAERARVVAVEAHEGRQVERGAQPVLAAGRAET